MKSELLDLPDRAVKPRQVGITHLLDRGLSVADVDGLIEVAGEFVDLVKLGWGTAVATGTFNSDRTEKIVMFPKMNARYIRFVATSEINGQPWTSISFDIARVAASSRPIWVFRCGGSARQCSERDWRVGAGARSRKHVPACGSTT